MRLSIPIPVFFFIFAIDITHALPIGPGLLRQDSPISTLTPLPYTNRVVRRAESRDGGKGGKRNARKSETTIAPAGDDVLSRHRQAVKTGRETLGGLYLERLQATNLRKSGEITPEVTSRRIKKIDMRTDAALRIHVTDLEMLRNEMKKSGVWVPKMTEWECAVESCKTRIDDEDAKGQAAFGEMAQTRSAIAQLQDSGQLSRQAAEKLMKDVATRTSADMGNTAKKLEGFYRELGRLLDIGPK